MDIVITILLSSQLKNYPAVLTINIALPVTTGVFCCLTLLEGMRALGNKAGIVHIVLYFIKCITYLAIFYSKSSGIFGMYLF